MADDPSATAPAAVIAPGVSAPDPIDTLGPAALVDPIADAVRDWANASLTNSPVSRDLTVWTYVQSVLPALVDAIKKV